MQSKTIAPAGLCFTLFFLDVDAVGFGYGVEFGSLVFLSGVFFVFVVKPCVVHVTFTNAFGVAFTYQLYE